MKKLLSILGGGCGGGCKKIFAALLTVAMLVSAMPVVYGIAPQVIDKGELGLGVENTENDTLEVVGNRNQYTMTVTEGQTVSVYTETGTLDDTALNIALEDPAGTFIEGSRWNVDEADLSATMPLYNDDYGDGYKSCIQHTYESAGTVYIQVGDYEDSDSGDYTVTAVDGQDCGATDEYDHFTYVNPDTQAEEDHRFDISLNAFLEGASPDSGNSPLAFFYRTNPALSGDSEEYLYGYGFGYFSDSYGYSFGFGYGFGYGYDYFIDNYDSFGMAGEWAKFGLGLGESYGNFTLPIDDNGEITLENEFPLEGAGSLEGLEIFLPAGLVMAGEDGWDGTINVEGGTDLPGVLDDNFNSANVVNVYTGGHAVGLSVPAVVKVPYANFDYVATPTVRIVGADNVEYPVYTCDDVQYIGNSEDADQLKTLDNYTLSDNTSLNYMEQCYIYYNDYVYVATNHFTTFAAGPAHTTSNNGGGSFTTKKVAKVEAVTPVATKVTDFADLLTLATTSWRYPVIQKMLDLGLFKGTLVGGKLYFNMDNTMTRAMAATVIARYMGYDDTTVVTTAPFEDVATTTWYASSVAYLKAQGVVAEAAKFNPNESVTRAQFFKMLVESYMKLHPSVVTEWTASMAKESTYFTDVTKANWYVGYMALAAEKGLLGGYMEGGLRYVKGTKSVSRVEAGSMLVNMLAL